MSGRDFVSERRYVVNIYPNVLHRFSGVRLAYQGAIIRPKRTVNNCTIGVQYISGESPATATANGQVTVTGTGLATATNPTNTGTFSVN